MTSAADPSACRADYRVEDGIAVLTISYPPVNALGHAVRIALCDGVNRALGDDGVKALVLICGGRTFFAGADVTELGRPIEPPFLADVIRSFEQSAKPIVSAIHGTALGGGFEVALGGHYRVAVPSATVGLPEVALGLLPGAGGTQRVPRLVGIEAAVDLIGRGRQVKAQEALALGLIDAVVEEGQLEAQAVAFAREAVADGAPLRRVRDMSIDLDPEAARAVFDGFRAAHPEMFVGFKAADGVMRALEAAATLPFDEGIAREKAISRELLDGPESAAQRHLFFAERAAAKIPGAEKAKAGPIDGNEPIGRRTRGVAEVEIGDDAVAALTALTAARREGPAIFTRSSVLARLQNTLGATVEALRADGVADADIAATGLAFGLEADLLPAASGGRADTAIEQRLTAPVMLEALTIVDEGLVLRASDLDYAAVKAGLWPAWRGGPAYAAAKIGAETLAQWTAGPVEAGAGA